MVGSNNVGFYSRQYFNEILKDEKSKAADFVDPDEEGKVNVIEGAAEEKKDDEMVQV
jgi:hypothetical protein